MGRQENGFLQSSWKKSVQLRSILKNHKSLLRAPKCPNSTDTLTLIKTSPKNFKLRQLARKSARLQKSNAILFLIGRHEECRQLDEEIEEYDDIIVGDFIDSYYNLTLKTLTGYRKVLKGRNVHVRINVYIYVRTNFRNLKKILYTKL